jgi:DNA-binding protein H-NS
MATLEKLHTQIAKLQAQADALIKKQSSAVIGKIRDLMEKHGLTVADIDAHTGGKKRGPKPGFKAAVGTTTPAKYRDPKTGATWTGHGRAPAWIASAKDRTRFLTNGSAAQAVAVPKAAAKAGNYVRGPQAAKYRDPKSGATWSGRGPAPAWLAGAKDRSKFLIAGAEESNAPSKPATAKEAAAKKTATAKVAGKQMVAKKSETVAKTPSAKKAGVKRTPPKKAVAKKVVANKAAKNSAAAPGVEGAGTEAP